MEEFLEKWKKDKRYQVKVKLLLYTSFVVIVSIFALSNRNVNPTNTINDYYNNIDNNEQTENNANKELMNIPEKYNYTIKVNVNEDEYIYKGTKTSVEETITKENNDITNNYLYKNGNYYIEENGEYILTTEENVYDKVSKNYIDLSIINQYLSKSYKKENRYLVYLKDIILGNNSENYITIEINENKIEIDYTSLIENFDQNVTKYLVNIDIEEIE